MEHKPFTFQMGKLRPRASQGLALNRGTEVPGFSILDTSLISLGLGFLAFLLCSS